MDVYTFKEWSRENKTKTYIPPLTDITKTTYIPKLNRYKLFCQQMEQNKKNYTHKTSILLLSNYNKKSNCNLQ